MAKDNLISLAKGSGSKKPLPAPTKAVVKKPVPKVVEKPKTKEEVRDEKAKETVEKLLQNVELVPKVEVETEEGETETQISSLPQGEGILWLEDQIAALSEENERLRNELFVAKEDYARLFEKLQGGGVNSNAAETILQNVLFFFNEMQSNYLGLNPQGIRFTVAYPERLLPKLVQLFPFLENYRKF